MPHQQNDLILLTCASAKQAGALIPLLLEKGYRLRLQAKRPSSADALRKQYPAAEVVTADLASLDDWRRILHGVSVLYLVGPGFHQYETDITKFAVDAILELNPGLGMKNLTDQSKNEAKHDEDAGQGMFKHLVYSSVLHPILSKLLNHDVKRLAEEYLIESGIPHTTIQPSHFMEMIALQPVLDQLASDKASNVFFPINVNPDVYFSFSNTKDNAQATLRIIEEREEHFFATYELVSTVPMTYREVRDMLEDTLRKDIPSKSSRGDQDGSKDVLELKVLSTEQAMVRVDQIYGGLTVNQRRAAARLMLYYSEQGLRGNRNVLRYLLGEEPTDVKSFLEEKVAAWRKQRS